MTAYYTIPLSPEPQRFSISLAGTEYRLAVRWFDAPESGWVLDIFTMDNEQPLLRALPLLAGLNLLEQFAYLGIGGELWLDSELPASLGSLGADVELVFVVPGDDDE